jgi:hypothetical protein
MGEPSEEGFHVHHAEQSVSEEGIEQELPPGPTSNEGPVRRKKVEVSEKASRLKRNRLEQQLTEASATPESPESEQGEAAALREETPKTRRDEQDRLIDENSRTAKLKKEFEEVFKQIRIQENQIISNAVVQERTLTDQEKLTIKALDDKMAAYETEILDAQYIDLLNACIADENANKQEGRIVVLREFEDGQPVEYWYDVKKVTPELYKKMTEAVRELSLRDSNLGSYDLWKVFNDITKLYQKIHLSRD